MRSRSTGRGVLRSLASIALGLAGAASNTGCYSESCADAYLCEVPPPEPSPCDGDPATAGALDLCGVFVSEEGDDNSPGTKDAPVRTLQHAIGLAASGRRRGEAPTRRVYACGGLFEEAITLPSGVDLWGSRRCDSGGDWSYDGSFGGPNELTVIAPPAGIPVRVLEGKSDAVLGGDDATSMIFGVRAKAADASASDGKSSIAMILEQGARAIVQASVILAGDGKDGEPGEDAPSFRAKAGVVGNGGVDACTANMAPGALPVVTVCDDGIESTGGQGGDGGREMGGDGTSGLPEPVGNPANRGLAGDGASSMACTDGQDGAPGADAERAAGAAGAGLLDMDGWVGVRGKDGEKGGVGQGGGGGGGGKGRDSTRNACPAGRPQVGAAGGSGGSGGCGGKGGKGGDYGGASIAIVALQGSNLTVDASTVLGAKGGDGGVGGTGQWGGFGVDGAFGGNGLLTDTSRGCRGGFGGDGGRGGDAGGGLGGHSFGIASVGASVAILQTATVKPGQAGKGGLGGNATAENGLGQGNDGTALFWYRFDAPDPEPPR
ncbi:hypothetical protein SOCEGT47_060420 [Sorangium cellulosum]|uniref:PGRS family protein n=1 Tax=Sorangium cellulosum TaxID=56 RepID=A0A4P2Q7M0_SORCE|nr:hypothetical protein [Sorangium cellulosum]AUX25495.1 hypothetical protein SOCEGT47_060420 [Sorangium cellulosum]